MPQIISLGSELIRINPSNNRIESSTTGGRTWLTRYSGSACGEFRDLVFFDDRIIALTDKGVYCSTSRGATWLARYTGSYAKSFVSIQDGGGELVALTGDGHIYASTSCGSTWLRRR